MERLENMVHVLSNPVRRRMVVLRGRSFDNGSSIGSFYERFWNQRSAKKRKNKDADDKR